MTQNEAGYATVTAAALLSALSITGIGFMHLSQSSTLLSHRISSDVLVDGELELHLAETITRLVNGQTTIDDFPATRVSKADTRNITISIEAERAKLDLNSTELTDFTEALNQTGLSAAHKASAIQAYERARIKSSQHIEIKDLHDAGNSVDCLRSVMTEFRVPAIHKRSNQRYVLDGEIYRIKVQTAPESKKSMVLDVAVLFTGNDEDPAWVLSWDRYSLSRQEECRK